jgi:hypothetical protein
MAIPFPCLTPSRPRSALPIALRMLLSDVLKPQRDFSAILIRHVSRWGRSQDPDEAARYEFICRSKLIGVPAILGNRCITRWIVRISSEAVLLSPISAAAIELVSPCPLAPASVFPALDSPPVIGVWHEKDLLKANWNPPSCTGWSSATRSRLLVTLAGQFRFNGTLNDLLDRIGAISSIREIRYWSADDKTWRPLVSDPSALTSPSPASRRDDFNANDLTNGAQQLSGKG